MKRLIAVFAFLLTLGPAAHAQDYYYSDERKISIDESARGQAAAHFHREHGPDWQIAWHQRAETPATLRGGTARGYRGNPSSPSALHPPVHKIT